MKRIAKLFVYLRTEINLLSMVRDDLFFMSEEQLKDSFLNKRVRIVLNDDQIVEFIVKAFNVTPYANNEACPEVGFISQSGKGYSFLGIKEIYVI